MRLTLEVIIISLIYEAGVFITSFLELSIPPAFTGMGILFLLFSLGIIKPTFFEKLYPFFNRHIILFLLPIIVGLINYGSLLRNDGIEISVIIVISTASVLIGTAWMMKFIHSKGGMK